MSDDRLKADEKEFVRMGEAASIMGVARQTITEWVSKYNIRTYPLPANRSVKMIRIADLRRALEAASRPITDGDEGDAQPD